MYECNPDTLPTAASRLKPYITLCLLSKTNALYVSCNGISSVLKDHNNILENILPAHQMRSKEMELNNSLIPEPEDSVPLIPNLPSDAILDQYH